MLVEGLPPNSALGRDVHGHAWQDLEFILHDISSQLRFMRVENANMNRDPKTPAAPDPELLATPFDGETVVDEAEAQYLEQQREEMDDVAARMFGA